MSANPTPRDETVRAGDERVVVPTVDGRRVRRALSRALLYTGVILGAIAYAAPFFWMLSTSVKADNELFTSPPTWIPSEIRLDAYTRPWEVLPFAQYYRNSAMISGINIVANLLSASLVAFAFARMRFPLRGPLFVVVLSTMMLPSQVTLIPLFRAWSELGLINTIAPLTIPAVFAGRGRGRSRSSCCGSA